MKTLTKQQWVGVGLLLLLVVAVEVFVQVALILHEAQLRITHS